ncbi:unnamed protein product [Mytilus edulis]|uniref:Uncharacterized protein n=1 Tax=Mytilus edulis TaxID=6550 RepID=A0A8S3SN72_MYTED|nr:unnamed protein product [Mytilus edulis]
MKLNSVFSSLMNKVEQFGKIHIIESNADLQLKYAMIDQAQIQVRWSMRNIHDINLQLKLKFDTQPQSHVTGCLIMSNGKILIADFSQSGKLIEYDDTGKNVVILQTSSLTVDNNQNVYVLSHGSYNLTLIQHDGKQSKEVLNASDDLSTPTAVCYNKKNNLLLNKLPVDIYFKHAMSVWIYWLLFSVKKYFLNSPSTKMTKEQPVPMCPGFYKLNLNLMHMEDISQIERRKEILEDAKVNENEIVQQAITLMVNLIDNRFSRRSCLKTSIQKLKEGFRTNPNHLNTLADLAEMHRQLNVYVEAKLYDDAIQRVLTSNDLKDRKEVAQCFLEQGYECLFEEFGNYELKARLGFKDISKQLIAKVKIASNDRKQSLQNPTHSLLTAQCLLDGM